MRSELRDWNRDPIARSREKIKGAVQVAAGIGKALIVVPLTAINAVAAPYKDPAGKDISGPVIKGRAATAARLVKDGFERVRTGQAPQ